MDSNHRHKDFQSNALTPELLKQQASWNKRTRTFNHRTKNDCLPFWLYSSKNTYYWARTSTFYLRRDFKSLVSTIPPNKYRLNLSIKGLEPIPFFKD